MNFSSGSKTVQILQLVRQVDGTYTLQPVITPVEQWGFHRVCGATVRPDIIIDTTLMDSSSETKLLKVYNVDLHSVNKNTLDTGKSGTTMHVMELGEGREDGKQGAIVEDGSGVESVKPPEVEKSAGYTKPLGRVRPRKAVLQPRAQELAAGFLEDYVEVCGEDQQGLMLESTVDEAVVITLPAGARSKQRLKQGEPPGKEEPTCTYRCHYCEFVSEQREVVEKHLLARHPKEPIKLRLQLVAAGKLLRRCPYCGVYLKSKAFFQHMRATHTDAHPFKCGYCSFMGRDVNQVKHHLSKKHHEVPFRVINLLRLRRQEQRRHPSTWPGCTEQAGAYSQYEYGCSGSEEEADPTRPLPAISCPVCHRALKTLTSLKAHMKLHKRRRFKCGYCGYLAVHAVQVEKHSHVKHKRMELKVESCELDPLRNRIVSADIDKHLHQVSLRCSRQPRDPDSRKWQRKYNCPHCCYTCNYGASYRRHLRLHKNTFPFRCNYCSYKGREKYYVRRHIRRIHPGLPVVVMDNIPGNRLHLDSSSDEDGDCGKALLPVGCRKQRRRQREVPPSSPTEECEMDRTASVGELLSDCITAVGSINKNSDSVSTNVIAEDPCKRLVILESNKVNRAVKVMTNSVDCEVRTASSEDHTVDNCTDDQSISGLGVGGDDCSGRTLEEKENLMIGSKKDINICIQMTSKSVGDRAQQQHCKRNIKQQRLKEDQAVEQNNSDVRKNERASGLQTVVVCPEPGPLERVVMKIERNDGPVDQNGPVVSSPSSVLGKCEMPASKDPNSETTTGEPAVEVEKLREWSGTNKSDTVQARRAGFWRQRNVQDYVLNKEVGHTTCICGVRTVTKAFYKHAKKHMNVKPFRCGTCLTYCSIERAKVRVHSAFMHPGSPVQVLDERGSDQQESKLSVACPLCSRDFPEDWPSVLSHMAVHYSFSPYWCGACKLAGASLRSLYTHWQVVHPDRSVVVEETGEQVPADMAEKVDRLAALWGVPGSVWRRESGQKARVTSFTCPICHKVINCTLSNVRRHLYNHFHYRPYKCGYCDYKGLSSSEIKQHTVTHGDGLLPAVVSSNEPAIDGLEDLIAVCMDNCRTGESISVIPGTDETPQPFKRCSIVECMDADAVGEDTALQIDNVIAVFPDDISVDNLSY